MSYPFHPGDRAGRSQTLGRGGSGSADYGRGNDENYGGDYGRDSSGDFSGHYGADPRELYHDTQSGAGYGSGPGTTGYGGGGPGSQRNSAYAGYDPRQGTARYGMYGVREQPRGGDWSRGGQRGGNYGGGYDAYGQTERAYPGDPAYRGADFGEGRGGGGMQDSMQQQWGRRTGPKGYQRSDERIREDVCERLAHAGRVDVSEVSVDVQSGIVMLSGTVQDRREKYTIETIVDGIFGVKDVQNSIRVQRDSGEKP